MRIDNLGALIAVLSLAAVFLPHSSSQSNQSRRVLNDRDLHEPMPEWWEGKRPSTRELQAMLRNASEHGHAVECCPSKTDMVEPLGGIDQAGNYVVLLSEPRQTFYEVSCQESVLDKPCRFVDHRLQNQSRCVQKYSYTYALVKEAEGLLRHEHHHHQHGASGVRLDYIRVRNGCSCEISPKPSKKKRAKTKRKHEDLT